MADPNSPSIYDLARQRAQQQNTQQVQGTQDALKRRFASLGMLNSGAAIKQQQIAEQQGAKQLEDANFNIQQGEAQAQEQQKNRDFSAGEALKGREFQAEQAGIDRTFQEKVFAFESNSKLRALDQMDQQLRLAGTESEFNRRLAEYQAGHSGGLLGAGGFLGTGIGARGQKI